jgi:small subunit ribosomal protein S11
LNKPAPTKKVVKSKRKSTQNVPSGVAHVKATFNNTIIAITDPAGRVVAWASAGKVNFSGSRKSSAFAATVAAQDAAKIAMNMGMREVEVNLKGPGAGRESAVRGLQSAGLTITTISDVTPVPHNGCRPRKRRRV